MFGGQNQLSYNAQQVLNILQVTCCILLKVCQQQVAPQLVSQHESA